MSEDFGFYFEMQGRSGEEGPIDPSQQYFEGSHAGAAVVRETGQNSLDNPGKNANGPIRMEFELSTVKTSAIPGISELRRHIKAVAEQTEGQQGHDRMLQAAELIDRDEITVLRISDFNTTGLTGSESLDSSDSPLSRLTRGKGGSKDDGLRGGSFGIGSAVGPMASGLSTVLYASLPEDSDRTVLSGYTRLATHMLNGTSYRAEGYFTRIDGTDDFEYLRPAPGLPPFPERTEPGTDIYVLGYRMAESDPELERIRDAVIDNFMAAIYRKRLVVRGIAPGNDWILDDTTLAGCAKSRPEAHAFYVALQDAKPARKRLKHVGEVNLYVNVDDRLTRKLHTVTMRRALMKIDTFVHNSISARYAAVLVCDCPEGNSLLRELEPPQHHKWDPARNPAIGKQVINGLKAFVRDALKERISEEVGDMIEIEGLAKFLPSESVANSSSGDPLAPTSVPGAEASPEESSSVTGDPAANKSRISPPNKKISLKIRQQGQRGESKEDETLDLPDTPSTPRPPKPGPPDPIDPFRQGGRPDDAGRDRILGDSLRFRSWDSGKVDEQTAMLTLAITAHTDQAGDLELVALGPGGAPEKGYSLPIVRARVWGDDGQSSDLDFSENTLMGVRLAAGKLTRIDLHLPAGERYRLEAV